MVATGAPALQTGEGGGGGGGEGGEGKRRARARHGRWHMNDADETHRGKPSKNTRMRAHVDPRYGQDDTKQTNNQKATHGRRGR